MLSGDPKPVPAPRRRWQALAALGVATLALHDSLLDGMAWAWRPLAVLPNPLALQVRTLAPAVVVPPPAVIAPVAPPLAKRKAPQAVGPNRAPVAAPQPRAPEAPPAEVRVALTAPEAPPPSSLSVPSVAATPSVEAEPAPPAPPEPAAPEVAVVVDAGASAALATTASASAPQVPADRTHLPPDISFGYDLRRGLLRGSAELQWVARNGEYTLRFDATVAGFNFLQQTSTGHVDDTGLAPRRFTDQRAGREVRATNFQREAGKISFSGPSIEFPLIAGTQDRLSLLIQLAGIVAADPRRREPGGQVAMTAVGVRGDLSTWVFRYVGDETVSTGLGPVSAAKFVRDRPDAYDTNLEVWLDPSRHHLPVRAVQRAGPDGEGLELSLRQDGGAQP